MSQNQANTFSKNNTAGHSDGVDHSSTSLQDLTKRTGLLANEAAHMVQSNASEYYQQGLKKAENLSHNVEMRIQKNPIQSLLIVAGVGLVMGALWNRR